MLKKKLCHHPILKRMLYVKIPFFYDYQHFNSTQWARLKIHVSFHSCSLLLKLGGAIFFSWFRFHEIFDTWKRNNMYFTFIYNIVFIKKLLILKKQDISNIIKTFWVFLQFYHLLYPPKIINILNSIFSILWFSLLLFSLGVHF